MSLHASDTTIDIERHLWVIGPMASGKTTISKQLVSHIRNGVLVNMDEAIVQEAGMPIDQIFKMLDGETAFRMRESGLVEKLAGVEGNKVISTGGGAPCFGDSLNSMKRSGTIVYLDGSPELLANRTMDDERDSSKPIRPLVSGMDYHQRVTKFREMLEKRKKFYEQAHIIVLIDGKDVSAIVEEILASPNLKKPSHIDMNQLTTALQKLRGEVQLSPAA